MHNFFEYCNNKNIVFSELFRRRYSGGTEIQNTAFSPIQSGKIGFNKEIGEEIPNDILVFRKYDNLKKIGDRNKIDSNLMRVNFSSSYHDNPQLLSQLIQKIGILKFANELGTLIRMQLQSEIPDIMNIEEIFNDIAKVSDTSNFGFIDNEKTSFKRFTLFFDKAVQYIVNLVNRNIQEPDEKYVLRKNNTMIMKQKTIKQAAHSFAKQGVSQGVDSRGRDISDNLGFGSQWDSGGSFSYKDLKTGSPDRTGELSALAKYRDTQRRGRELAAGFLGNPTPAPRTDITRMRFMRPPVGG